MPSLLSTLLPARLRRWVIALLAGACLSAISNAKSPIDSRSPASPPTKVSQLAGHAVFVVLKDGSLAGFSMVREEGKQVIQMQISTDGTRSWALAQTVLTLPEGVGGWGGPEVLVDNKGEVHLILLNDAKTGIIRTGEAERRPNMSERRLDIWHAMSSSGRTRWQQPTKIWEGYTGSLNSIIQMRSGRIVLPFSYRTTRTS